MRTKIALAAGLLFGTSLGATALSVSSRAEAPAAGCAGSDETADIAAGEGTIAISNRSIVVVGNKKAGCHYMRPALDSGLLRHLAVQEGTGTAYVDDEADQDVLVVVTGQGTTRIESRAEITHPTWSSDGDLAWATDMSSVRVMRDGSRTMSTIARPRTARAVFSPTYVEGGDIAVVGQESVPGLTDYEDDQLNNLWAYDESSERWSKWTDFDATADRWSIIRTPVALEDGSMLFVRITGRASATMQPRFQLWSADPTGSRKLRELPGEMFLAGTRNGRLLWNVFSERCGDWELLVESSDGLDSVGCGSVLVDPVNLADPDLEKHDEPAALPAEAEEAAPMGVIVGDFSTRSEATAVTRKLAGAEVISHEDAPLAVRPDAYAVSVRIPEDASAEDALESVRKRIPNLRSKVFLAPLTAP